MVCCFVGPAYSSVWQVTMSDAQAVATSEQCRLEILNVRDRINTGRHMWGLAVGRYPAPHSDPFSRTELGESRI